MWNQIQSSWPPASSTSTRRFGSADSRLANTQPAEPAPTTIWSNVSVMAGEPSERRRERKRLGWLLLAPFENRQRLTGQMRRTVLRYAADGRRVAGEDSAVDPLRDRGQAEDREGHVERPVLDRTAPRTLAIGGDIIGFRRDAAGLEVDTLQRAPGRRMRAPQEGVVGDVGERVANGRQLPVEHRNQARLGRVVHDVLEPVIAMGDGDFILGRNPSGELLDERLHLRDQLALGAAVLLGPAGYLTLEIAAGLAVVAQAGRDEIDLVQLGQGGVEIVVDRRALGRGLVRQFRVPEDAAFKVIHDVEGRADHSLVRAQRPHLRHRHVAVERLHDLELAIDLVGAGQQHAGRLLAQDVAARAAGRLCRQQEGGVGGPALELLHDHGVAEILDLPPQPGLEWRGVEVVRGGDVANGRCGRGHDSTLSLAQPRPNRFGSEAISASSLGIPALRPDASWREISQPSGNTALALPAQTSSQPPAVGTTR